MGVKVTGLREFSQFTGDFPVKAEREVASVLRQEGRAVCIEMGANTMPGLGFGGGEIAGFEGRIERDVKRVFATMADANGVMEILKRRSPGLAKGFWRVVKQNPAGWQRDPQAVRYLRAAGVRVESLDASAHKAARTGAKGRVPGSHKPAVVVSAPQRRAFIKRQQAKAGLAKAAWYAAAKAIGGRVRSNDVDAVTGKRSTAEQFSPRLRKLARRFAGIGGAVVSSTRVTVFSNVTYAGEAISQDRHDHAVYAAQQRLHAALWRGVREIRRKGRFGAAA